MEKKRRGKACNLIFHMNTAVVTWAHCHKNGDDTPLGFSRDIRENTTRCQQRISKNNLIYGHDNAVNRERQ